MKNQEFSRRNFVKSSALASLFIAGSTGCSADNENERTEQSYPVFTGDNYKASDGITGLLFSQVGYDTKYPVRIVVRLPKKDTLAGKISCRLQSSEIKNKYNVECNYWGELWGSHWWVAEFPEVKENGCWEVQILQDSSIVYRDYGLKTAENILRDETIELSSVDILERRFHFTGVGAGWQDAGTLWVESPAQSAMIIGLEDMLEQKDNSFDEAFLERIYKQISVGCDYLVMTQVRARKLGHPEGAMSHDVLSHEKFILPNDVCKAVVALYKAARILPEKYIEQKANYKQSADLAYKWLVKDALPWGEFGFNRRQRGLPENTVIPGDEWMTRELVFFCWGGLEQWKNGVVEGKESCIRFAKEIMERQITKDSHENNFYGHFREFLSLEHSEKAWCHGIEGNIFGADAGGIYPNYLLPLIEMLNIWPEHEDATKWKNCLENFAYGYLIPSCNMNPFRIVPLGIFGDEGPIWFAGPFHGTSCIYGYTAALAFELSALFNNDELKQIAYSNLQWLAGLNSGITAENLKACVVYSTDIPEGIALPASLICDIGKLSAGTWFRTRGVICNGFSTGTQFKMDVDPTRENDGPSSFTDEDWIPHSAAWVSGIIRIR
jgi:hypothetical protein